ncbi:MAG: alpha/beta fold hydrolase [Pseudomonadales bacterium]|nr:alpha/beta fold hydrolase [Pseudomonadales bacterium]
MKVFRTPDTRFVGLPDFAFEPHYLEVHDAQLGALRMHYVDEGPRNAPAVLMLHGEPSWSFAWRHVIAGVVAGGFRAIAPDHIGFGRSDKPAVRGDYSYVRFVDWMDEFVETLDLHDITLLCQDWGGPIGLSVLARQPQRFAAVVAGNTLLPNCEAPPRGVAPWPGKQIEDWVALCATSEDLPVAEIVSGSGVRALADAVKAGYDAPFPDARYKAGALAFTGLIPTHEHMPGVMENRAVWRVLEQWHKPFVTAFSDADPSTRDWAAVFRERIPGARNTLHTTIDDAGHFLQEEQGAALAAVVLRVLNAGA